MTHRGRLFVLLAWSLLSLWMMYGGLELAEELHGVEKVGVCVHDLDMDALIQLASGLRSDVLMLECPLATYHVMAVETPPLLMGAWQRRRQHTHPPSGAASLRLHQRISVYLI